MTLFDDDVGRLGEPPEPAPGPAAPEPRASGSRIVRVVPAVPAMGRELDYVVPPRLAGEVTVGAVVRIPLQGRRVRGWVVAADVEPQTSARLESVAHVTGLGPDAAVIDLCRWAAWRWAGRLVNLLRVGTPERAVHAVSSRAPTHAVGTRPDPASPAGEAAELLARGAGVHVLTVSPVTDLAAVAVEVAKLGQALVVAPQQRMVSEVTRGISRAGGSVAAWPGGLGRAAAGHTVVGGRSAVWAPMPQLRAVVVFDEHDEGLQHESSPTWHAREVAIERARRAGVPCVLVSPCPSLEALGSATSEPRSIASGPRRRGWAHLDVVDRRGDDPRTGLYSSRFVEAARSCRADGATVVCVLNRKGRARLLACRSCDSVAECAECSAAVRSDDSEQLACARCGATRPMVCLDCGATAMKLLRVGVTRSAEELEALLGEPIGAVSASDAPSGRYGALIGTEAVLHRAGALAASDVGLVAFLDVDQELLAPRYRAGEEALALLVAASRLLGGRSDGRSLLVQTRKPHHAVLEAAKRSDPARLSAAEEVRRDLVALPPAASVAAVGGEAAEEWIDRLGRPEGIEVNGPREGWWLVRADDPAALADACARVRRPPGRLRLRVDPVRLP